MRVELIRMDDLEMQSFCRSTTYHAIQKSILSKASVISAHNDIDTKPTVKIAMHTVASMNPSEDLNLRNRGCCVFPRSDLSGSAAITQEYV